VVLQLVCSRLVANIATHASSKMHQMGRHSRCTTLPLARK
jgi:hypothetical protein